MIYIGTSGYSYQDWIGPFYPEGTKSSDMLYYYAQHFNFVEINSSFYHMPSVRLFAGMQKKTPEGFMFSVKLFGGFTHERNAGKAEAENFLYSLRPILERGQLLCLLAQFPYSFHRTRENLDYLKRLREWFGEVEVSVEFRNQEWINEGVMEFLKACSLGFVCVDEPAIRGLVRRVAAVTSDTAYLRLHGRNAAKWYSGEGSQRYDYLYSTDELLEWVPLVNEMRIRAKNTVVAFNNHPVGKAVVNAREFERLL